MIFFLHKIKFFNFYNKRVFFQDVHQTQILDVLIERCSLYNYSTFRYIPYQHVLHHLHKITSIKKYSHQGPPHIIQFNPSNNLSSSVLNKPWKIIIFINIDTSSIKSSALNKIWEIILFINDDSHSRMIWLSELRNLHTINIVFKPH